jgi:hypothetical protein
MKVPFSLPRSLFLLALVFGASSSLLSQASYTAQIRGVVTDQTGASIANATVTITNVATNISTVAKTDSKGLYLLPGLRPDAYVIKAEATGFRAQEKKDIVLQVSQQTTISFSLSPAGVVTTVEVTTAPPLLDTESASLGTDVTNEYVRDIPLYSRNMFGLVFLAGGVTETTGSGITDNYPTGTNFVSNGQRNATAEITLDGSPISAPEQGEGGNSNVYYQPSVEIVQEFKVQNNSFSAEFGNNGGTVVNMVLKQGGNNFHGSGWWYGQRANFDARDFFNPAPNPKPDHVRDQYGFSLGGPLKRNKTFFFADFEKVRQQDPFNLQGIVPTAEQRTGDFSQHSPHLYADDENPAGIFDPCAGNQASPTPCTHSQFPNDTIPASEIDPIGQAILNLYPMPNVQGAVFPDPNWRAVSLRTSPSWQFDVKLDHQIAPNHKIGGRYSRFHNYDSVPTIVGDGDFGPEGDGVIFDTTAQNGGAEYNWAIVPTALLTSRFSVDRVHAPGMSNHYPTLSSVGLSPDLAANGLTRMSTIGVDDPFLSLFNQCCVDTQFAHTLVNYSSAVQWVKGAHSIKFGGEQRVFFNYFRQPDNPTGIFNFSRDVTTSQPNNGLGDSGEGNPFATILLGYPHDASLHLVPAVADKSKDTAFFVQDDWKATPRLTLNLGLRYEWSTPYTERFNRLQFNNFTGDTGINIPVSRNLDDPNDPNNPQIDFGQIGEIRGTSIFATSSRRNSPVDRNNFAPRFGFAYELASNTVLRGGAGVFYGMNVATNFQYAGPAYAKTANMFFTKDNFDHQFACLGPSPTQPNCPNSSPFPGGLAPPQGTKYGKLAQWGYSNSSDLDTGTARNAEIYQWNIGIQHLFPGQIVIAVDYSANRSTHLPWGGAGGISTSDRNFLPSSIRNALVAALNPTHDPTNNKVTDFLNAQVPNPFQCFFTTGAALTGPWCPSSPVFSTADVVDSRYLDPTIPQQLLLEPYPQFDGGFNGLPRLTASSWYHALQIRFQKRASHYISFEGNYTFSKATDDSSAGRNAWVGNLGFDNPQVLDNLRAEHAIGANDTPHRLTAAIIFDVPVGKDRLIGRALNPVLDAVVGGWSLNGVVTLQSGQPLNIYMSGDAARFADGNQRPDVTCSQLSTGLNYHAAAKSGGVILNENCFADPGDNIPGNAPRYFSQLRSDGIRNLDASLTKEFTIREGKVLQVRAEMFNTFNHQRFAIPDTAFGEDGFGTVTSTVNNFRRMQFGARFQF